MKKGLLYLILLLLLSGCYSERVMIRNENEYRTLVQLRYKYDLNSKQLNEIRKKGLKGEIPYFHNAGNDQGYYDYKPDENEKTEIIQQTD